MGYDGIYLSRVVKPQLVTYQQNTSIAGPDGSRQAHRADRASACDPAEQIPVSGKLLDGGSVSIL